MLQRYAAHEHTGSAVNTPAFPAQWLYGLYEIVLVTLLFVTPSPAEAFASRQLDACIGASDPNDFTVRKDNARDLF